MRRPFPIILAAQNLLVGFLIGLSSGASGLPVLLGVGLIDVLLIGLDRVESRK